jgi:putative lysine/arginine/ornithine/histidine/octopine transport system permease protein
VWEPSSLQGFGGQLLLGARTTVLLAIAALALGTLFGLAGCALQLSKNWMARSAGYAYAAIIRSVPDLLIVFLMYFGGTQTLNSLFGRPVEVDAFVAGAVALGFSFGAFSSEIFRGAVLSVPKGQLDAAMVLGLSPRAALLTIVIPQALRVAIPPFGNQAIVLLKQTSLVSVIGCDELMRKAGEAAGATREPFTMYVAAAIVYLVLTGLSTVALDRWERHATRYLRS